MNTLDVSISAGAPALEVLDPATGEPIGHVPAGSAPAAHIAVSAALAAQPPWAGAEPEARGALLKAGARQLREHARELAELHTREAGTPIGDSLAAVEAGIGALEAYAELGPADAGRSPRGDLVLREPRGVVAILGPWCDPFAVCGALSAALVSGNAVVLKPSEKAPLALSKLVERLGAGDVLQALHGDERAVRPLTAHAGVDVVIRPGEESGGGHVLIVDEGVDPEWAAGEAAASAFAGAGQPCGALARIHVHQAIAEPFLDALVDQARALTPAQIGPLIDDDQRLLVHRGVRDAIYAGAVLRAGGEPLPGPGYFYPPTVLSGGEHAAAARGPVAPVRTELSFEAALAGAGPCGIASVLTPSHEHAQHAWRELEARTVSVNAVFRAPRGGGDPALLDAVTRTKTVHLARLP